MTTFVQIGATRDGSDPYLHVAHSRGMETVLIEIPEYICWRKTLGRQEFDRTISVEHPSDPEEVIAALNQLAERPALILAGFERYIYSAYAVARHLHVRPYCANDTFVPLNKAEQRAIIAQTAILQPGYFALAGQQPTHQQLADFHYPLVVKPVDGGGGLGVLLAKNFHEVEAALTNLQTITNYDGGQFRGTVIEEYIAGTEYSVQGLVHEGQSAILTFCKRYTRIEPAQTAHPISGSLHGFREIGRIAIRGDLADAKLKCFAQACVDALGYHNGPFHIDVVQTAHGYYHLEMGFRLSGFGLVSLVQRVSGYDWAVEAFDVYLGKSSLKAAQRSEGPGSYIGQFTVTSSKEIANARYLQRRANGIEIQHLSTPCTKNTSPRLKSDLMRHTGAIARITLTATTLEAIEDLVSVCLEGPEQAGLVLPTEAVETIPEN